MTFSWNCHSSTFANLLCLPPYSCKPTRLPPYCLLIMSLQETQYATPQSGKLQPLSATVVSAEPFSHGTGTLRCLQKEMATYRHWSVSSWRDPDDVPHCRILSPDKTEWRLILATICGWRRCFVADQLWFLTRIREEDYRKRPTPLFDREL